MNNNEIKKVKREIKKEVLTPAYLKQVLNLICDDVFVGFAGSEHYIKITEEMFNDLTEKCHGTYAYSFFNKEYSVPQIDYRWYKITKEFTDEEIVSNAKDILEKMIEYNYNKSVYYTNVKSSVVESEDKIIVEVEYESL